MDMNNLDYFELATKHKEGLIDPNYHFIVDRQAIPKTVEEQNPLTISNSKVIEYITCLKVKIVDLNQSIDDTENIEILNKIIKELETKGMNYSAFCQYFNVHNVNYSVFSSLDYENKIEVLKFIVIEYIKTRHDMYVSHGYSNIILQVMSDNYSHKRKGTYGTNKIADALKLMGINNLAKMTNKEFEQKCFFLLTDKDGKKLYKKFSKLYGINLTDDGKETEKYPDALIKIGNDFFVVEQKNMKENGGGQDKQTLEITDFIDKEPEFTGLHYITFIDGIYFNQIEKDATAKTLQQYTDIVTVLTNRKSNYFVNSYAFEKLIEDKIYEAGINDILEIVKN